VLQNSQAEPSAIVSAQVDLETRDELRRRAREADRTVSAEIRVAIREHLRREDEKEEAA
jgi:post-segregation antitoxin (ccd killing protein)